MAFWCRLAYLNGCGLRFGAQTGLIHSLKARDFDLETREAGRISMSAILGRLGG